MLPLPSNVTLLQIKPVPEGETNNVFFCQGVVSGENKEFFLKITKNSKLNLKNEEEVIAMLKPCDIPVSPFCLVG